VSKWQGAAGTGDYVQYRADIHNPSEQPSRMANPSAPSIVAADVMRGDVLIHFTNGIAVHYRAPFLWDIRENEGSVVLTDETNADEPLTLPD